MACLAAMFPLLADTSDITSVIFRSIVLIALVIGGMYAVLRLRRWLKSDDDDGGGGIGFTLSDLRALHRRGEITDAEFEKARAQMLSGAKEMASKLPDPLARPDRTAPDRPR
jgi:hypothetical protein